MDNQDAEISNTKEVAGKETTEKVEFDKPEQEARFKQIYGQMIAADKGQKALIAEVRQLKSENEEMKAKQKAAESSNVIQTLRDQIKTAREAGDDAKADSLLEQLGEVKTEQKMASVPKPTTQAQPADPYTPEERQYTHNLAQEKNEDGSLLRPWMAANHPLHQKSIEVAMVEARGFESRGIPVSLPTIMTALDRVMEAEMARTSPVKRRQSELVSGTDLTSNRGKTTLFTDEDKEMAKRLNIKDTEGFQKRREALTKSSKVTADMF